MAKYVSHYSGERIDHSVKAIPDTNPKEESILVISSDGKGSYKKVSEVGVTVVQETGKATDKVMSQKIVTDSLNSKINYTDISNGLTVVDGKVKANIAKIQDTDANEFAPDENGVVTIPAATNNGNLGLFTSRADLGLDVFGTHGWYYIVPADENTITARGSSYNPLRPATLNFAVKAALTDDKRMGTETSGTNTAFTDTEKDRACEVIGASRKLYRHYATFDTLSYGSCKLSFISLKSDAYSSAENLSELKDVVSVEYCTIGDSGYLIGTLCINPIDGDYTLRTAEHLIVISTASSFTDTATEL